MTQEMRANVPQGVPGSQGNVMKGEIGDCWTSEAFDGVRAPWPVKPPSLYLQQCAQTLGAQKRSDRRTKNGDVQNHESPIGLTTFLTGRPRGWPQVYSTHQLIVWASQSGAMGRLGGPQRGVLLEG